MSQDDFNKGFLSNMADPWVKLLSLTNLFEKNPEKKADFDSGHKTGASIALSLLGPTTGDTGGIKPPNLGSSTANKKDQSSYGVSNQLNTIKANQSTFELAKARNDALTKEYDKGILDKLVDEEDESFKNTKEKFALNLESKLSKLF